MIKILVIKLILLFTFNLYSHSYQISTGSGNHKSVFVTEEEKIYYVNDLDGNLNIFQLFNGEKKAVVSEVGDQFQPWVYDNDLYYLNNIKNFYNEIYKGESKLLDNNNGFIKRFKCEKGEIYIHRKKLTHNGKELYIDPSIFKNLSSVDIYFSKGDDIIITDRSNKGKSVGYFGKIRNDSIVDYQLFEKGRGIISSASLLNDSTGVISLIKNDSNKDGIIDLKDNSVIYYIYKESNGFKKLQLTLDDHSSIDPYIIEKDKKISIYYSSNKGGEFRIWRSDKFGEGYSFDKENFEKLLSTFRNLRLKAEIEGRSKNFSKEIFTLKRIIDSIDGQTKYKLDFFIEYLYFLREVNSPKLSKEIKKALFLFDKDIELKAELLVNLYYINGYSLSVDEITSLMEGEYSDKALVNLLLLSGIAYRDSENRDYAIDYYDNIINYYPKSELVPNALNLKSKMYQFGSTSNLNIKIKYFNTQKNRNYLFYESSLFMDSLINSVGVSDFNEIQNNISDSSIKSLAKFSLFKYKKSKDYNYLEELSDFKSKTTFDSVLKAEIILYKADLLIESGRVFEATLNLKDLINSYPNIEYGSVYERAIKILYKWDFEVAKDLFNKGIWRKARSKFLEISSYNPKSLEVYRGIVETSIKMFDYDGFLALSESIKESSLKYYSLAYFYSLRGADNGKIDLSLLDLSDQNLQKAIDIDDSNPWFYLLKSYNLEARFHKKISEVEYNKNKSNFLKSIDYLINPLIDILDRLDFSIKERENYLEQSEFFISRGLNLVSEKSEIYRKLKMNLANLYFNYGEFTRDKAYKSYKELENSFKFRDMVQEGVFYSRLAVCCSDINYIEAEKYFDKSEKIFNEIGRRDLELKLLFKKVVFFLGYRDRDGDLVLGYKAAELIKKIIDRFESEGEKDKINIFLRNLGYANYNDLEFLLSEKSIESAIDLFDKGSYESVSKDDLLLLSILGLQIPLWQFDITIGSIYPDGFDRNSEFVLLLSLLESDKFKRKDFYRVIDLLKSKLEKSDKSLVKAITENRIGSISYLLGDYISAEKYFNLSLKKSMDKGYIYGIYINSYNLAKLHNSGYAKKFNLKPIIDKYGNSFSDVERVSLFNLYVSNMLNIDSSISIKNGKKDLKPISKIFWFEKLLEGEKLLISGVKILENSIERGSKRTDCLLRTFLNLGDIYYYLYDDSSAKKYYKKSLDFINKELDKELYWRLLYKLSTFESDETKKLTLLKESEKICSSIYRFDMVDYNQDLYKKMRLIYESLIPKIENSKERFNYIERYKGLITLTIYSSRDLEFGSQKYKAHIKKVRDSRAQISSLSKRIEKLKIDSLSNSNTIEELRERKRSFERELNLVYRDLKKDNDTTLLDMIKVNNPNLSLIDSSTLVIDLFEVDSVQYFTSVFKGKVKSYSSEKSFKNYSELLGKFPQLMKDVEEAKTIYIVPDYTESIKLPFGDYLKSKGATLISRFNQIAQIDKNRNINNDVTINIEELKDLKGSGIFIFPKIESISNNPLDQFFREGLDLKEIHTIKSSSYLSVVQYNRLEPLEFITIVNSLVYMGSQAVYFSDNFKGVDSLKKDALYFGFKGFDEEEALNFAKSKLNNYVARGSRFYKLKRYEDAIYFFKRALYLSKRSKNSVATKKLYELLTDSYYKSKNYRKLISIGSEYLDMITSPKKMMQSCQKLSIAYYKLKEYSKSSYYQERIKSIVKGKSKKSYANAENLLSIIYFESGEYRKSIKSQKSYLELLGVYKKQKFKLIKDLKKPLVKGVSLLLSSYYKLSEYEKGLNLFEKNRDIIERLKSGDIYRNLAYIYKGIGDLKSSEENLKLSLSLNSNISTKLDLAENYYSQGNGEEALDLINGLKNITKTDEIRKLNIEALIEQSRKKYKESESRLMQALDIAISEKDFNNRDIINSNLARLYNETGESEKLKIRLDLIPDSLDNLDPLISKYYILGSQKGKGGIKYLNIVDSLSKVANNYLYKARSLRKRSEIISNKFEKSALLDSSISVSQKYYLWSEYLKSSREKLSYLVKNRGSYIEIDSLLSSVEKGYYRAKSRSKTNLEIISEIFNIGSFYYIEQGRVNNFLDILHRKERILNYNNLVKYDMKDFVIDYKRVSLESLKDDEVIISITPLREKVLISYLKREDSGYKVVDRSDFEKLIKSIETRIGSLEDITTYSKKVYSMVINRDLDSERIYFYSPEYRNFSWDLLYNGKYLIEDYDICVLSSLKEIKREENYKSIISYINGGYKTYLEYADFEAERALYESGNGKIVSGENFLSSNLGSIKNYNVLHFATHGGVDERNKPYLLMSDGNLYVEEILDIEGKDLIVSSCETGDKLSKIIHLTKAGAVIIPLWKVDDLATAVLFKRYFRYYFSGKDRVYSLSQAKRDMIKYFKSSPYFWSGFYLSNY